MEEQKRPGILRNTPEKLDSNQVTPYSTHINAAIGSHACFVLSVLLLSMQSLLTSF